MSKPPIKAMEAVKRYCEKRKVCEGCPLYSFNEIGYCFCFYSPANKIVSCMYCGSDNRKEGDTSDADPDNR